MPLSSPANSPSTASTTIYSTMAASTSAAGITAAAAAVIAAVLRKLLFCYCCCSVLLPPKNTVDSLRNRLPTEAGLETRLSATPLSDRRLPSLPCQTVREKCFPTAVIFASMIQSIFVALACLAVLCGAYTNTCQKPQRKSFTVVQDLEYKIHSYNETLVSPSLAYTTCVNPKFILTPYSIFNDTTVTNVVTNMYYYHYTGTEANVCDPCTLEVADFDDSDFPLVGCPLYDITSLKDLSSSPQSKSEVTYTYF